MPESVVGVGGRGYTCATCGKQYQRSAHLRRHESTHIEGASYKCPYCEKSFARRDVCRKHTIHCPNKKDHEAIPILKRGQKPRACDACFHSKQSCDTSDPCERCVSRKLACTYHRLEDAPSVATDSSASSTAVGTPTNNNDKDRTKITVAFLLGLTNPNSENILEFLASEAAARTEGDGLDSSMRPVVPAPFPPSLPIDQDFAAFIPYPFVNGFVPESIDYLYAMSGLAETSGLTASLVHTPTSSYDSAIFESRAAMIVSELEELHHALKICDPWYDGAFDRVAATSVFSAENLCMFAATYFRVSHIDFPILHRPDFGTDRTTKELLIAVAVSGALRSPPSDDALAARGYLSLIEEYIFRRLHRLIPNGVTPEWTHELEASLQAAVMIHSVQFFRNDMATRRKNRTQRLPVLVQAVRCLGLAQTRHAPLFQYDEFVRNESRIRLATWMALADWQQTGMFNVPSMISTSEMTCDLPCPLELWDASDAEEYHEIANAKGFNPARRIVSLKHCMDALMSDSWNGMGSFPFQDINATDLQILIFGINGMVLTANLMGVLGPSTRSLSRAISRWEAMWETIQGRMDPTVFEKSGMVRYNTELCWAAKQIIKVAISGDRSSAYMQKVGHESLVELHEFMCMSSKTLGTALPKFGTELVGLSQFSRGRPRNFFPLNRHHYPTFGTEFNKQTDLSSVTVARLVIFFSCLYRIAESRHAYGHAQFAEHSPKERTATCLRTMPSAQGCLRPRSPGLQQLPKTEKAGRAVSEARIRDRSEQERNSPDINSPVDSQSPGFLGLTSYLGIYEETRDALSPFQPQLTSRARRSGINTPNTEPEHRRVSDAIIQTCISVLQSIPRKEDAQVLFGSHFNECDIAFQLIAPRALDRFYHHYDRLFETMDRNVAKLSDLAEIICTNTSKVFVEDEPDGNRYIDQFSGENTRWETLGLLFAYWFLGSRGVKTTPKTVKSAAVLRKCLNDCVLLARATASKAGNTLSVYLHYKRGIVDSVADGDASLSCWQSHGECVTLLTSLGLHIDDSAPNQPYVPTLASELRRRLFGHVFHSDKAGSTFTGRPPVLCGKFTSTPLPLALRDEDLLADEDTRKAAAEALDSHGWNRDGALPPVGNLRARVCFSMIRDDIFEIALAVRPVVVPALQTLMGIKERQLQAYAQLPSAMRLNTAEVKNSTLNDGTLYTLMVVHLEHLQNLFFVEQLLFRGGHTSNDDLLRVSFEMVSTAVMFWTNMDRFTPLHWDFMWLVMAYAAPGGGVLCLELLRPTPTSDSRNPKPSRSNIIQQLSLLVGFLSWVKPSAPNADLCADCKVVIQHVLDHALNETGAVGNALPVDISSWDVSAQLDFNFDLMDTFDWLRPDSA